MYHELFDRGMIGFSREDRPEPKVCGRSMIKVRIKVLREIMKEIEEQMGHEEIQLENERFTRVSLHTEHLGFPQSCIIWPPLLVTGIKVALGAKSGEMTGGSPTGASTRMGSQQGSWK